MCDQCNNKCECSCDPCKECKGDTNKQEHWLQSFWRPAMAWQYFVICMFDFFIAPILLGIYTEFRKISYVVWTPLTLQGGGLYHVAMGAIIGVSSWARGQEKVAGITTPNVVQTSSVTQVQPIAPTTAPVQNSTLSQDTQQTQTAPVKAKRIAPLDINNM